MSGIELHQRWFPKHFANAAKIDQLVELRASAVTALRTIIDAKRNLDDAVVEGDRIVEALDKAEAPNAA